MSRAANRLDALARELAEQVRAATAERNPLRIQGSGSKAFHGRRVNDQARPLDLTGYQGVIGYEPTELVITAAVGTSLETLDATLAEGKQMLGFEPPRFGPAATLGGTVACGLSGPIRPYTGSVRDFVLGVKIINGKGEILRFGGQVMKNVAGYDVSRLMVGSLGTLGVLLEVSLRVLPRPAMEQTLVQEAGQATAIEQLAGWSNKPYPLTGVVCDGRQLYLRLSGSASGVAAAADAIGGDLLPAEQAEAFWSDLREQRLAFFAGDAPLWRLSLPPATPPLPGASLLDWGGAQRWLRSDAEPDSVFSAARAVGGHATLFRGGDRAGSVFQPLSPELLALHQRLKTSFDPAGIFNPGRLYPEL